MAVILDSVDKENIHLHIFLWGSAELEVVSCTLQHSSFYTL